MKFKKKIFDALKDYAGGALKKKIIELATGEITQWLFSRLPFLAWGPIGAIVSWIVTKGIIRIIDKTIIGAHVLYIYADTTFDRKSVEKIIKKINQFGKEVTDEERKKLDDELAIDVRELIRYGTIG